MVERAVSLRAGDFFLAPWALETAGSKPEDALHPQLLVDLLN
jgi:hypothetical protein